MKKIIFFILLIICFYKINSQNVLYDSISVDEFINKINDVSYDTEDYNRIIISLINSLTKYYIFVNITKNPPINIKAVDLINELKSINVSDIKDYLEFYNVIQNIMLKAKDLHLMLIFSNLLVYNYLSPVEFNVKTLNETNYLYLKSSSMLKIYNPFNKSLIKDIDEKKGLKILKINNQDPFDSIYNFYNQLLKDEHGSFSINLKLISAGNILFGFKKENFTNFSILFEDNSTIKFDYKMIFIKNVRKEFKIFYEKEIKKYYETSSFIPTIFELEEKYNSIKNSENRFLQNTNWNITFENSLKLKVDEKNKVNVIYQSSFMFTSLPNTKKFLEQMNQILSSNKYPIIVIESYNSGGYVDIALLLQKILNYNLVSNRLKVTLGPNKKLNNIINKNMYFYNTETCNTNNIMKSKIYEDNFGNNITHYRTQFYLLYNTKKLYEQINSKTYERKPTEIIIFTDGFSYSATSLFIKDLHESGNAIIVGYNGIPNEKRKKEKFNGSQSPSMVITNYSTNFLLDDDIEILKYFNIYLAATFSPSYNDKYQNDSLLQIPREFTIELIDERSSIYGSYDDTRYDEFIEEGLRIFKHYNHSCNPNHTNLLYKSDCQFEDKHTHGGYLCGNNGNWSQICKPSYCDHGYYFDTYLKKCKKDQCYSTSILLIVLIIIAAIIIVGILIYCFWNWNKKRITNNDINGKLLPNNNTNE
jgi:hypothetical protein